MASKLPQLADSCVSKLVSRAGGEGWHSSCQAPHAICINSIFYVKFFSGFILEAVPPGKMLFTATRYRTIITIYTVQVVNSKFKKKIARNFT
jgi:hypothetical protein